MSVQITVLDHPLAADALRTMRDRATDLLGFRSALHRLAGLLMVEATRHLPTVDDTVETPLAPAPARRLAVQPVVVPVLRAGLGLLPAALDLLPEADAGFVGISRDEQTAQPHPYVNKLPSSLAGRPCLVLDPMVATGGSLAYACSLLVERDAPTPITVVCVLAAPEGIERLRAEGLHLNVVTAAIDERLDERSFIVPGLGDAGDRLFGSVD